MQLTAKSKFVLVILSIAFLFLNAAGVCAGMGAVKSASHPCCPRPAGPPQHGSTMAGCICIDRQPAAPSVPANAGEEQVLEDVQVTAPASSTGPNGIVPSSESAVFSPQDRFLQFRQLLL